MAQAALPTKLDDRQQPLATSTTPDGSYRLLLFPGEVVAIQKPAGGDWKTVYVVRSGVCPCSGHQFRGSCKHLPWAQALIAWGREHLSAA